MEINEVYLLVIESLQIERNYEYFRDHYRHLQHIFSCYAALDR